MIYENTNPVNHYFTFLLINCFLYQKKCFRTKGPEIPANSETSVYHIIIAYLRLIWVESEPKRSSGEVLWSAGHLLLANCPLLGSSVPFVSVVRKGLEKSQNKRVFSGKYAFSHFSLQFNHWNALNPLKDPTIDSLCMRRNESTIKWMLYW